MVGEFDLDALYRPLDVQRQAKRISWTQVARETIVSASTLRAIRAGRRVEGDGVLAVLRWLVRSPESFMGGEVEAGFALPDVSEAELLRFDAREIYAALDDQRRKWRMTWRDVAMEIGIGSAASLTRLQEGGRVSFPSVMRILAWLGAPAARFVRVLPR